jgi:hypothetical protein
MSAITLPQVVALTGAAGSGKTTAADYLIQHYGYQRVKFADPLKKMLRCLGLAESQIEGELKESPIEWLDDRSPRYLMQTLGTEWGRHMVSRDIWVSIWRNTVDSWVNDVPDGRVVVDDCRFANEAEAVRALGGRIIALHRPGAGLPGRHASEAGIKGRDLRVVVNDGDVPQLNQRVLHELVRTWA